MTRRQFLQGTAALAAVPLVGCSSDSSSSAGQTADADGPFMTSEPTFALTNALIFDGQNVVADDTVVIRDGLVVELTQAVVDDTDLDIIDVGGRVLLPGLIDAHVHGAPRIARPALTFGTTSMFEMFGGLTAQMRDRRDEVGSRGQADAWSSGTLVTAPGGHGTQWGDIPTVDDGTDVPAFVADRLGEGSDYIKLVLETGQNVGSSVPTLTAKQTQAIVAAAHDQGVQAFAHVATWEDAAIAAEAGIDALVHAPASGPVDDAVIGILADAGTPVVATLAIYSSMSCVHDSTDFLDDPDIAPYLAPSQRAEAQNSGSEWCFDGIFAAATASVTALHEAGVRVLAGTDVGNLGIVSGVSLLHELDLLSQAGLTTTEVLAGATAASADLFGLTDRGRIAPDQRADLVLMNATSLDDVIGSYSIAAVWKNGHAVERQPSQ
jgi:imidazolonepropionase-like amidohydrolase